ncbi:DNA-directed DNA polymerase delta [Clydaea vesicula]|uniref:DNA polymerase n=1 Tax=Clydaea vesicula TaxID=447962 RepID=A0AAD5U5A8_9FUNG|nr:DNA-directed DNA polymerase delta [Clydaea vesicula]
MSQLSQYSSDTLKRSQDSNEDFGSQKKIRKSAFEDVLTNMMDENDENAVFQQLEIDDYEDSPYFNVSNPHNSTVLPCLRMFGVTDTGNSVLCHVHGFQPYFYAPAPYNWNPNNHTESFRRVLDMAVRNDSKRNSIGGVAITHIRTVQKKSIYGYRSTNSTFLKIFCRIPSQIAAAKRLLEKGIHLEDGGSFSTSVTFESNIQYTLRFMIDRKIVGANWIELPAGSYTVRDRNITSSCQLEVDVIHDKIVSHDCEGEWSRIAPLRILSFDIECAGRKGIFPDANIDPVIQIANMVTIQGQSKPFIRNVFTLNKCANIAGIHTLCFDDERDLLKKWHEFVSQVDPDLVIGYNTTNFDLPYILERTTVLKVSGCPTLGRIIANKTVAKETKFSSKAYGTRESKEINLDGRLQLDMLQVMQRDHKLRSYTLNSVCAHFLDEQKEDVHHSVITDLQNGNEETRRRLAIYCIKDAYLPQRLMDKLMCLINYIEMARVTGIPFNYLLARGQQIKVVSQLYRKTSTMDLIIPAMKVEGASDEVQYEGATVIEPEKGFYEKPIATLDFASLYPSIMMAHNLCYSTYLESKKKVEEAGLVLERDCVITPNNGVLVTILEDLISARKKAKFDLKLETDPFKKAVLDGRQLALKISANSVYGFTGATIGKLPLLAISSSVTAYGREMIEKTKELVEEKFTIANGYEHDAKVIYGDTDSVMVKFGCSDLAEAMRLGKEGAQHVSTFFVSPISLEFEKVYFPYLLINKKRYAGLYWTKPDKYDKLDAKGIETVRRDSCRLVSYVIQTCLNKLLIERDTKGAEDFVKNTITDLLKNKIDLSQLVISKALGRSDYVGKQAHDVLAKRMKERDAGSAPSIGDRVSYVIVKGTKGSAAYEKAEDPIFVLENNLPIDTKYYLENQLSKPLLRIFEPILGDKSSSLLSGDHTRTVQIAAPSSGGLMKFAVRNATCLGCRVPLGKIDTAVCKNCKPRILEIYSNHLTSANVCEVKFSRLWTQCQRCQGSLHQDVICTSQDCPIFYMRKKAQKEVNEVTATLKRFDYSW